MEKRKLFSVHVAWYSPWQCTPWAASAWLASPPRHLVFCSQRRTQESQGQTQMMHHRNRPRARCFLGTGSRYPLIVWGQQERERGVGPRRCLRDEHPCYISIGPTRRNLEEQKPISEVHGPWSTSNSNYASSRPGAGTCRSHGVYAVSQVEAELEAFRKEYENRHWENLAHGHISLPGESTFSSSASFLCST